MNIWVCDFETFFSDDYTLKKLSTEHYIRDPRFEALMLAVRDPKGETFWVPQEDIKYFLGTIDWTKDAILCHHAHFDGLIFSHHYGVRPRMWFDTLSMARLVLGNHLSVALGALAKHYGLEDKSVPYDLFRGKRWADIDPSLRVALGEGACHDVSLTWDIFARLAKDFPQEEYAVIDATVRMFTEPVLVGDAQALEQLQQDEQERKYLLLNRLGVTEQHLQSAGTFVKILENLGVEVEYKEGSKGPIPAIAKTDDFMKSLEAHPDETISTLAAARLEVRSTLNQTRAGRLLGMAQRGNLPVYLSYCGAHTARWSGGDRVNLQNLPRGGAIRKAISAPEGCLLAVVDASQIECRILNYVAGQHNVLEAFRQKRDLYCENASRFYGREITRADKLERGLGKTLELGCGYGLGWQRLQAQCHLGAMGSPPVDLTEEEARRGIDVYRNSHSMVTGLWKEAEMVLRVLADKGWMTWRCGMLVKDGRLYGPNGTWLNYTTLEWDAEDRNYRLKTRKGWSKYYGAKLVENVIQWLARIVMSQAMLRTIRNGYRVATTTHDELVVIIPDDGQSEAHLKYLEAELALTPQWMPGIPLAAEGSVSKRYEK